MPASSMCETGLSQMQNGKIIEMIFLASDLAHSCEVLEADRRGVTQELIKSVNRSISLLKRLLADNERESDGAVSPRARLVAIRGGVDPMAAPAPVT